jgi:hypothetical protein
MESGHVAAVDRQTLPGGGHLILHGPFENARNIDNRRRVRQRVTPAGRQFWSLTATNRPTEGENRSIM